LDEREVEPFEPPKILGDVFESVMGAVFEDGGIEEVVRVYKHLLSPLIIFVAKHSKVCFKEPKEQFIIKALMQFRIRPQFLINEDPIMREVVSRAQTGDSTFALMYKAEVLFRKDEIMCHSYGNSKRQAERNASVEGLRYLAVHPELMKKELQFI